MKKILILMVLLLSMNFISAVPKIEPYVNDFANILTEDQELSLNLLADSIEKNTTYEIAMVTTLDTEGQDRIEYANRIGDENGVGKKGKDNGIVILWSLDNERGLALATGRYSESMINDAKAGRILRNARHYFDDEFYYEGLLNITKEINEEIKTERLIKLNNKKDDKEDNSWMFVLVIAGGLAILGILMAIESWKSGRVVDDD